MNISNIIPSINTIDLELASRISYLERESILTLSFLGTVSIWISGGNPILFAATFWVDTSEPKKPISK